VTAEALARIDADLARRVEAYLESSVTAPTSRALITDLIALIPEPPTVASVEEWSAAMDAERQRQIEHGYGDAHDREHGPVHILNWAIDYARRGRVLEAATMMRSALHVLTPAPPTDDEREAVAKVLRRMLEPIGGEPVTNPEWIAAAIVSSEPWRNRHRGPVTDEMVDAATAAYEYECEVASPVAMRAALEAAEATR
jgi:hypothetical protein